MGIFGFLKKRGSRAETLVRPESQKDTLVSYTQIVKLLQELKDTTARQELLKEVDRKVSGIQGSSENTDAKVSEILKILSDFETDLRRSETEVSRAREEIIATKKYLEGVRDPYKKQILGVLVRSEGRIGSVEALLKEVDTSRATLFRKIKELVREGRVQKVGGGAYRIPDSL